MRLAKTQFWPRQSSTLQIFAWRFAAFVSRKGRRKWGSDSVLMRKETSSGMIIE